MKFAQIYNNKVHWIFEAEVMPEFAPDIVIIDITEHPEIKEGWDYDANADSFSEPIVQPVEQTPTLEEQVAQLQGDNLILMDVLATMYEAMLAKGTA